MMRGRLRSLVAAVALSAALLTGCGSGVAGTEGKGYISGDGQTIRVDAEDRGEPIELRGEGIDGKTLDLADYRGKPVALNVWGSWCGPCRSEMPILVQIDEELGDEAALVGINIRENDTASAQAFMRNKGGTWPSFYSPDGKALQPFLDSGLLNPKYTPTTLVLDSEGRVAAAVQGEITKPGTFIKTVRDIAAGN